MAVNWGGLAGAFVHAQQRKEAMVMQALERRMKEEELAREMAQRQFDNDYKTQSLQRAIEADIENRSWREEERRWRQEVKERARTAQEQEAAERKRAAQEAAELQGLFFGPASAGPESPAFSKAPPLTGSAGPTPPTSTEQNYSFDPSSLEEVDAEGIPRVIRIGGVVIDRADAGSITRAKSLAKRAGVELPREYVTPFRPAKNAVVPRAELFSAASSKQLEDLKDAWLKANPGMPLDAETIERLRAEAAALAETELSFRELYSDNERMLQENELNMALKKIAIDGETGGVSVPVALRIFAEELAEQQGEDVNVVMKNLAERVEVIRTARNIERDKTAATATEEMPGALGYLNPTELLRTAAGSGLSGVPGKNKEMGEALYKMVSGEEIAPPPESARPGWGGGKTHLIPEGSLDFIGNAITRYPGEAMLGAGAAATMLGKMLYDRFRPTITPVAAPAIAALPYAGNRVVGLLPHLSKAEAALRKPGMQGGINMLSNAGDLMYTLPQRTPSAVYALRAAAGSSEIKNAVISALDKVALNQQNAMIIPDIINNITKGMTRIPPSKIHILKNLLTSITAAVGGVEALEAASRYINGTDADREAIEASMPGGDRTQLERLGVMMQG